MKEDRLLLVRFKSDNLTAQEYIDLNKKLLQRLKFVHEIFENLCSWGKSKDAWYCFDTDYNNFDKVLLRHIYDSEVAYINPNIEDKEFYPYSYSPFGFSNSYSNTKKVEEGKITVSISAGNKNKGILNIQFPQINYSEFEDLGLVRKLISAIIETVKPEFISYTSEEFMNIFYKKEYKFHLGYLNYFKHNNISTALPKNIITEDLGKGITFGLSDNYVLNRDDINSKEVLEIRDNLGVKGFLNYSKKEVV